MSGIRLAARLAAWSTLVSGRVHTHVGWALTLRFRYLLFPWLALALAAAFARFVRISSMSASAAPELGSCDPEAAAALEAARWAGRLPDAALAGSSADISSQGRLRPREDVVLPGATDVDSC
jgi:hypothetical protein